MGGQLGHLPHVVVPLLQAEAGKTEGGLTTAAVLLGEVDGELVENLLVGALDCAVEGAVSVHDDETEGLIVNEELVQVLGVEFVIAEVERGIDGLEGLRWRANR